MNVLSLFDGISAGQVALERAGIKVDKYFASEIDKHAIKVTQKNYPNTIQLGDVVNIDTSTLPKIDLLIGGSPCIDISFSGKMKGIGTETLEEYLKLKSEGFEFEGQSFLFWEYIRILREVKPKYFLVENVRMKKEIQEVFERELGVKAIAINSNLVSAQNRYRLYFTNIPNVTIPEDKGIVFKDIMEHGVEDTYRVTEKMMNWIKSDEKRLKKLKVYSKDSEDKMQMLEASHHKGISNQRCFMIEDPLNVSKPIQINPDKSCGGKQPSMQDRIYLEDAKSPCLTATFANRLKMGKFEHDSLVYRYISPIECERLQTFPDGFTEGISKTQRYKALGNSWTVDVIAHIFKGLLNE